MRSFEAILSTLQDAPAVCGNEAQLNKRSKNKKKVISNQVRTNYVYNFEKQAVLYPFSYYVFFYIFLLLLLLFGVSQEKSFTDS